jgi:hypothetical protein
VHRPGKALPGRLTIEVRLHLGPRFISLRAQHTSINDFCRSSLHIETLRSILFLETYRSRLEEAVTPTDRKLVLAGENRHRGVVARQQSTDCYGKAGHQRPPCVTGPLSHRTVRVILLRHMADSQSPPDRRTRREDRQKT